MVMHWEITQTSESKRFLLFGKNPQHIRLKYPISVFLSPSYITEEK